MHPAIQQWTVGSSITHLRTYISQLDVPFEDIQRYLVYRIRGTAEPPVPPPASVSAQESPVHAEQVEASAISEVKKLGSIFEPLIFYLCIIDVTNRIYSLLK